MLRRGARGKAFFRPSGAQPSLLGHTHGLRRGLEPAAPTELTDRRGDLVRPGRLRVPACPRSLIAIALLVVLFVHPATLLAQDKPDQITLAGTFNGWNTNDEQYALTKVGERYELTHFWTCGSYEFKFVFNGSWDKHLGDAGGGKVAQPGGNIAMAVQQSGEYAVCLDPAAKRWSLERRPSSRPRALICARDITRWVVALDGSGCLARADHPIREYRWEFSPPVLDEKGGQLASVVDRTPYAHFAAPQPGLYEIRLTVSDGEYGDTCTATKQVGEEWLLVEESVNDMDAPLHLRIMLPLPGDRWAAPLQTPPAQEWRRRVVKSGGPFSPPSTRADRSLPQPQIPARGSRLLVLYNSQTDELSTCDSNWYEFVYSPKKDARLPKDLLIERAELVGDFDGWQPGSLPMFERGERERADEFSSTIDFSPVFRRILLLPDGVYHYKFLVNGCVYLEDPKADPQLREPDGRGGYNSGVLIGDDAKQYGAAKPNEIAEAALKHDPTQSAYFETIGKSLVRVALRTLADDVQSVSLCPFSETTSKPASDKRIPLRRAETRYGFDYWTAQVLADAPVFRYVFVLQDGTAQAVLAAGGVTKTIEEARQPFEGNLRMSFETPEWAKNAVWYQIFPERFRNGDPNNDPPRTAPWRHEWFKPYKGKSQKAEKSKSQNEEKAGGDFVEEGDSFYKYIFDRRYGGDIQGIREKLPYLRSLGVTAIYLNPVFQAASLHKYDASDYRHIDDFFGVKNSLEKISGETEDPATWQWSETDEVFLDFLKEAHAQGFKVIIDGVFNHTGREFWAFQDILKNKEKSRYVDWFDITSFEPFHYKGWGGDDGALPRLKHDEALGLSKPVREHLFAITRRWMDPNGDGDPSDGIDGWRLDVASDINMNFWRDWRKVVKSVNPDAYIVAELWEKSPEWLTGDTFDAVMNYPFARSLQRFFVNQKKASKPDAFGKELLDELSWYPPQVSYVLQNLIDSHDTDRVASMFMNPDLEYDKANRLQDNGPKYDPSKPTPECYHTLKALVTVQMTALGAPMVYYGDEVGMYGADDPSDRKPMLWPDLLPYDDPNERIEQDVYEHYRRMIAIRNAVPALRLGTFEILLAETKKGMFAFSRTLNDETIVVVVNNSDRARKLNVPVVWPDGSNVVRLDDPAACKLVDPPADDPKARPALQPVAGYASPLKVAKGRLQGVTLEPRTAGVFRRMK